MPAPQQPFTSRLEGVKGYFSETALDFGCKLSANVEFTPPPGRCGHINSDGEWETGVTGGQTPMFIKEDPRGPSHNNPGAPTWYSALPPDGKVMILALVGFGAYELETTEYDTTKTYAIDDPLRALHDNSDSAVGGTLTNAGVTTMTASSDPSAATAIVGRVSHAPLKRQSDRGKVLGFWCNSERGGVGL